MVEFMSEGVPALQVDTEDGLGLRVVFVRHVDRYAHRVEILDGGSVRCCLKSREGTSDEPWPPSPPLHQLSLEEPAPGRRVALLLGMAGRSHWSTSVECDPASGGLIFDCACRVQQPPQGLGSCYRADIAIAACTPDRVRLVAEGTAVELESLPLAGQRALTFAQSSGHIELVERGWAVTRLPSTIRWKYRITVARCR